MSLNVRFEIIAAKYIGSGRAKELSSELDAAYDPATGSGSLSNRGEQLMSNLIGQANAADFKAIADSAGPENDACEAVLAKGIRELDAVEVISLFDTAFGTLVMHWTTGDNGDDDGETDINAGGALTNPGAYLSLNYKDSSGADQQSVLDAVTIGSTIDLSSIDGVISLNVDSIVQVPDVGTGTPLSYIFGVSVLSGSYGAPTIGALVHVEIS
jgi:hypothetical protein